jgi:hypothetical protein
MKLGLIVEGHGEVQATPLMVRRVLTGLAPELHPAILPPHRVARGQLVKEAELQRAVEFMARKSFVYYWPFYTTEGRTLDNAAYLGRERWGRMHRELEQIDGTPNPFFARWLEHPTYDASWQGMIPYREEFARIGTTRTGPAPGTTCSSGRMTTPGAAGHVLPPG